MKYKIKIYYQTGNSFHTIDANDYLDLEWNDLNIAKENLKAVKDHYLQAHKPINERRWNDGRTREEILNGIKNEWWFVESKLHNGNLDPYIAGNCMKLKTDNGKLIQQSCCFWCGHFDQLYKAEIITDDSDMKFEL